MEREGGMGGLLCSPHLLWLGDFNCHHPLWDEPRNAHLFTRASLDRAQEVIEVIASYDLQMALPGGMPTLQVLSTGNYTRPDNVFASTSLIDAVVKCSVMKGEWPARTDHFPIDTVMELGMSAMDEPAKHNFRAADWQVVCKEMAVALMGMCTAEIGSIDEFHWWLHRLSRTIQDVIDKTVPKVHPLPYTKHWWSQDLAWRRAGVRKLACRAYSRRGDPSDPVHAEYRTGRNAYGTMIDNAKKTRWENFLQSLDEKTVWSAHRYASGEPSDGGKTRVPTLKVREQSGLMSEVISSEGKSKLFEKAFFLDMVTTAPTSEAAMYPAPSSSSGTSPMTRLDGQ